MNEPRTNFACSVSENDLHAYVDGELTPARRAAIETYLACNVDARLRVDDYRRQNIALHELFDRHAAELVLLTGLDDDEPSFPRRATNADKASSFKLRNVRVALLLVVVYALASLPNIFTPSRDLLPTALTGAKTENQIAAAHDVAPAETLNDVQSLDRTARPRRLKVAFPVAPPPFPEIEIPGFRKVDERKLSRTGTTARQTVFQDDEGSEIELYVSHTAQGRAKAENKDTPFTLLGSGSDAKIYWESTSFAFLLVGHLNDRRFVDIAVDVLDQTQASYNRSAFRSMILSGKLSETNKAQEAQTWTGTLDRNQTADQQ